MNDGVSLVRFGEKPQPLKAAPARVRCALSAITQHHARQPTTARAFLLPGQTLLISKLDGNHATLLTGYGGFQISLQPYYAGISGKLWLERGGVYVMANLRGGGEFGPAWHEAGRRAGKKVAQDDMAAVARDLIARGVTRPARLACQGGSNGGLLTGNMYARYPELFGAVISQVPLLDMWRYTKLSAGQSWIAEYGDPDKPEDWAFLRLISAYQLVQPGRKYPPILLTTSARDDRVHPGHARKMAVSEKLRARPGSLCHEPPEGGHAGAADNANLAYNEALSYASADSCATRSRRR